MEHNIKLLVMDVDGTLTDGKIYIGDSGEALKVFSIKDGYGIKNILPKYKIIPVIITGRNSKIVTTRCGELNIKHVYQGISNKVNSMKEIIISLNIQPCEVVYIGDDDNDYECMKFIGDNGGIIACPNNASNLIKSIDNILIMTKNGGDGCVRELIDNVTSAIGELK